MRRRIIAVIALIPALLFGCAGPTTNTTAQTGNTSSQEVAQEDSTQNSVTLTALQRSDGWNYGGSGSDGFYYVSSSVRDDGSANLMYLDINATYFPSYFFDLLLYLFLNSAPLLLLL